MRIKICTFLLIAIGLFILPHVTKAIYFASDTVYLHNSGKKITDDAIYVVNYKSWSDRCQNGVCSIGQQFYPVTIYLPKEIKLLTQPEFDSQYSYLEPVPGSKTEINKDEQNNTNTNNYLRYLEENSSASTTFNPGPSTVGDGCKSPGCLGGRIGDNRSFDLDINTGNFKENQTATSSVSKTPSLIQQFFTSIILFFQKIFSK